LQLFLAKVLFAVCCLFEPLSWCNLLLKAAQGTLASSAAQHAELLSWLRVFDVCRIASLRSALCGRPMWVAAHTQPGEEDAVATVHTTLAKDWPSLLTVLAPAASGRCGEVAEVGRVLETSNLRVISSFHVISFSFS
jgi:hypothetical protein